MSAEPAALQAWDTAFFGLRVAHVTGERLTEDSARAVDAWCAANAIDLCVLLADGSDTPTAHAAVKNGYFMLDSRVMLDCDLTGHPLPEPRYPVRPYRDGDLPDLTRIAGESLSDSRFHLDPYFPKARIPDMYGLWLRQRCGDTTAGDSLARADAVFVADADGLPAGFLTCIMLPSAAAGRVDLVAVDSRARGRYIGESMVREALRWFAQRGCRTVEVVTQGRNLAAQRTYQRGGFAVRRVQAWYHKWMTHGPVENPL